MKIEQHNPKPGCQCIECARPSNPQTAIQVMESEYEGQDQFIQELDNELNKMRTMLIEKNRKYGDSALSPIRVMSKVSAVEAIQVRQDDKLSRMKNRQNDEDEDPEADFVGYYFLKCIAKARQKAYGI